MTIDRFNLLTLPQQHYYTMKCGVYLSTRHENNFAVYLFQFDSFYAELFYEHGDLECSLARPFTSTRFLEPYLPSIDIYELLNQ